MIFRQLQTIDLQNGDRSIETPAFKTLIGDLATKLRTRSTDQIKNAVVTLGTTPKTEDTRQKTGAGSLHMVLIGITLIAELAIATTYFLYQNKQAKLTLASKLNTAARSTLLGVVKPRPNERGSYWWSLLSSTDRPELLERAIFLALESVRLAPSAGAESTLSAGLALLTRPIATFRYDGYTASAFAFSPTDDRTATVGPKDMVRLSDAATGNELRRFTH